MLRLSVACMACALVAGPLSAQQSPGGIGRDPPRSAAGKFAIDVGILDGGVSYATRLGASKFRAGLGLWGAWEPAASVEQLVVEPIGGVLFLRYQPSSYLMADLGPTAMTYRTSDDCSTCSGSFLGVRSTVLVGYRFVFLGPELAAGSFRSRGRSSEFGIMYGAQLRFVIGGGAS